MYLHCVCFMLTVSSHKGQKMMRWVFNKLTLQMHLQIIAAHPKIQTRLLLANLVPFVTRAFFLMLTR